MARQVAVAVGRAGTDELPGPRLLELAAPEALAEQRAFVLGDGALDLKRELVARIVGDGAVEELDRASHPAELLQQEHLVGVAPGQPVGGENGDDIDFPSPSRTASRRASTPGLSRRDPLYPSSRNTWASVKSWFAALAQARRASSWLSMVCWRSWRSVETRA
jgi:hypothetical protein